MTTTQRLQAKLDRLNKQLASFQKGISKVLRSVAVKVILEIEKVEWLLSQVKQAQQQLTKQQIISFLIDSIQNHAHGRCTAKFWSNYGKERIYLGVFNGIRNNQYGYIDCFNWEIVRTDKNSGSTVLDAAYLALKQINLI